MTQYDLILTQNVSVAGIEFSEKLINLTKGGIISSLANRNPAVLAAGPDGGYHLEPDSNEVTGLKWVVNPAWHAQGTDVGTTSTIFELDSDGYKIELTAESATKMGIRVDGGATYADLQVKDLTVYNLTVNGTTTTINSTTLQVNDKNIELGIVETPTDATADGGGITLKGTTDKTIIWDDANDNWTLNQNVNIPTGYTFKINNTTVLSSTQVHGKTLGSMSEATATDYVAKSLFDANTILFATSNDTPAALLGTELLPKLWAAVPADKIGTGYTGTAIAGQMARDANFIYVCDTGGAAESQAWSRFPKATNWVA